MLSTKIRTIIIALAAVGSLSATASVASAALVRPVGVTTQVQPVQPTAVAAKPKEVGSAGIKGYDNLKCEQMQTVAEGSERDAEAASKAGETKKAENSAFVANMMWTAIGSSCLVVD
jgi:hypothetical protein